MWKRITNNDHHHLLAEVVGHVYGIKIYHDERTPMIKVWVKTNINTLLVSDSINGAVTDLLPDSREFVRLQTTINMIGIAGPDFIAASEHEFHASNGG